MKEVLKTLREEWDNAEYVEEFGEESIEELFNVAKHYEDHIDWMLTKPSRAEEKLQEELKEVKSQLELYRNAITQIGILGHIDINRQYEKAFNDCLRIASVAYVLSGDGDSEDE